MWFVA